MKACGTTLFLATVLTILCLFGAPEGMAAPVTTNSITLSDQNIFADYRGVNDVGLRTGPFLQYGGQIAGGSAGYSAGGVFTSLTSSGNNFATPLSPCVPESASPDFCAKSAPLSATNLNGTWAFKLTNGSNTASFALPSVTSIPSTAVPSPADVTITNSSNGINPTIQWALPAGFSPNDLRVDIYDRSTPAAPNGINDIIHSVSLSPSDVSYTIPTLLSSGQSLIAGDKYTLDFQLVLTRDGGPNTSNSLSDILARSDTYFDFTPQAATLSLPINILLPTIDLAAGTYDFNATSVSPDSTTYIDPTVATGYKYDVGAGNPNFATVLLPNVGDGRYSLTYGSTTVSLNAGVKYFFPAGGVSEFTVTGIEASAGLDPSNTSAFVTGLTFVSTGQFTGTMTPIVEQVPAAVPEPSTVSLLLFGLAAVWRKRYVNQSQK